MNALQDLRDAANDASQLSAAIRLMEARDAGAIGLFRTVRPLSRLNREVFRLGALALEHGPRLVIDEFRSLPRPPASGPHMVIFGAFDSDPDVRCLIVDLLLSGSNQHIISAVVGMSDRDYTAAVLGPAGIEVLLQVVEDSRRLRPRVADRLWLDQWTIRGMALGALSAVLKHPPADVTTRLERVADSLSTRHAQESMLRQRIRKAVRGSRTREGELAPT